MDGKTRMTQVDAVEELLSQPRDIVKSEVVTERMALAQMVLSRSDRPEEFEVERVLTELAKEVVRLRQYAEECYELLQADRGWDVLDDVDKRLRKLYMGLNGETRWDSGVGLMQLFGINAKDIPPTDIEGDAIDKWDRLVAVTVWATTYAVAQGRWAVIEHRQADQLRDALLNGADWFEGTVKPHG